MRHLEAIENLRIRHKIVHVLKNIIDFISLFICMANLGVNVSYISI